MRKLSIGIQSFEDLRKNDYIYVDKTRYIYDLVSRNKVYFLSRPRRFGKSLFLSTIEAYFEGKKELFNGLSIEKVENESQTPWEPYPVFNLSFATGNYTNADELNKKLLTFLRTYEEKYNLPARENDILGDRFVNLMKEVSEQTGKNVVILIDEYDKPLIDNMSVNNELEEINRRILKGFYCALKDGDKYIKFAFVTGVTKFNKVSLFSDVNQLKDISLNPRYAEICGITEEEMIHAYGKEITEMADSMDIGVNECVGELRQYYDGYHFSKEGKGVYNPFSLINALSDGELDNFWFSTGTPTFLINSIKKSGINIEMFEDGVTASEDDMTNYRAESPNVIPLFYQTGYLTISGYDKLVKEYKLSFPNDEVKYGFYSSLVPTLSPDYSYDLGKFSIGSMLEFLDDGAVDKFMNMIKALLASIPYWEGTTPANEQEWRNLVYVIFALLGQYVSAEVHSSKGRSDFIVENEKYVYIFEFKKDLSAKEALEQIETKGYAVPYESSGKKIIKIGANFSTNDKTLSEWVTEGIV